MNKNFQEEDNRRTFGDPHFSWTVSISAIAVFKLYELDEKNV